MAYIIQRSVHFEVGALHVMAMGDHTSIGTPFNFDLHT